MKKLVLLFGTLFLVTSISFGQQQETQKVGFKSVAAVEDYIRAVEIKMEYVNNDPEEKKKAEESGWFDKMEENLKDARRQKAILEQREKENNNK